MVSKRKLPFNIVPQHIQFFQHELEKVIPDHRLDHYKNALVTPDGVVFVDRKMVEDSLFAVSHKPYFGTFYKLFYLLSGSIADSNEKPALLAFDAWSIGYFHWMTEFIPRLFKARHLIEEATVILPSINNGIWNSDSAARSLFRKGNAIPQSGYYSESLEAFGVQTTYRHKAKKPLRARELYLSGHLAPSGNYDDEVMRNLREFYFKYYKINAGAPKRLVYVTRNLASRRHIHNEHDVVNYLRSEGFEIFSLETLSLVEQIRLLSETKFLVAQHGAALTNVLFMREYTYVLELKAQGDTGNLCYFSLASAMNVNYLYQFCTSDRRSVQDADIEVDLDALGKNLKLVLNP